MGINSKSGTTDAIIGFCETATALGQAFYASFSSPAEYIHTTREILGADITPLLAFEEEHSHATSHKVYAENQDDLIRMLSLIFKQSISLTELGSTNDREVYDLTKSRQSCITADELDSKYEQWIEDSKRENSMNQYGMFMSVVSYINNTLDKKNLVVVTEKRKHW